MDCPNLDDSALMAFSSESTSSENEWNIPYYTEEELTNTSLLGEGAGGMVFRAESKGIEVAFKKFNGTTNMYIPANDKKEIEILCKVKHPNIVQIFGILCDRDNRLRCFGYVMEYMKKGCLSKVIYNASIEYDTQDIYQWIIEICQGLHFLHGNGLIHRDIKPANILVGDELKLADFGVAKDINSTTTAGAGTYQYMAPEVISTGKCSEASDIYSLGITIWEICHRKKPYDGESVYSLCNNVLRRRRPEIEKDKMYGDLALLTQRCWSGTITDRPRIETILRSFTKIRFPEPMKIRGVVIEPPPGPSRCPPLTNIEEILQPVTPKIIPPFAALAAENDPASRQTKDVERGLQRDYGEDEITRHLAADRIICCLNYMISCMYRIITAVQICDKSPVCNFCSEIFCCTGAGCWCAVFGVILCICYFVYHLI